MREVHGSAALGHRHLSPATPRLTDHEPVPGPVALVLGVIACHPSRGSRQGRTRLPSQLPGGLIETHYRTLRIALLLVQVQHVLHPRHELPAQPGDSKERTFESTFVIPVRKRRRKAKSGEPQSKKASSPAPTANTRKRKPAKASRNGKTTTVQPGGPKDEIFELVAQVPGQVKKASKPRKRQARPRRTNTEQRALPDLPTSGGESKA